MIQSANGHRERIPQPASAGSTPVKSLSGVELPRPSQVPHQVWRSLRASLRICGPRHPGAKSAGENTNTGVGAAIANAVYDAVGVRIMTDPITAERVLEALQAR
jgi:xanthine dehydrogenase YagR molybdenum-binding subunit